MNHIRIRGEGLFAAVVAHHTQHELETNKSLQLLVCYEWNSYTVPSTCSSVYHWTFTAEYNK